VLGASVVVSKHRHAAARKLPHNRFGRDELGRPDISGHAARVNQTTGVSDTNGMPSIVPSVGTFNGRREVDVLVTTGAAATINYVLDAFPAMHGANFPLRTLLPLPAPVRTRAAADER